MSPKEYVETFDEGPGGWCGWISNQGGPKPLEWTEQGITSRSPWWVDYNHAPPGAGYLHMLAALNTAGPETEANMDAGGPNRFIAGGFPVDFTGASLTVRLQGELRTRGAAPVLLIQGVVEGICSGWALTEQPLTVSEDWSEQTLTLEPDPAHWTPLGSRHNRTDTYGVKPLARVLAGVNANIMFIMFPLKVVPMGPLDGDPHVLRPEREYPIWRSELPEGYVTVGSVRVRFAGQP